MMAYQDKYTWSHRLGDYCLAHHDGAVSLAMSWSGFDYELNDTDDQTNTIDKLLKLVKNLDTRFFYEAHGWRDADASQVDDYLSLNEMHIRGGDIAKHMRKTHANHLRPFARTNDVALVITFPPVKHGFGFIKGVKGRLIDQSNAADKLLEHAHNIKNFLPGCKILFNDVYEQYILRTSNRYLFLHGNYNVDPNTFLNHQLAAKPEVTDGFLYRDGIYHSVIFVPFYPDAVPGWIMTLFTYPIDMHFCQGLQLVDREKSRKHSELAQKLSGDGVASGNKEATSKRAGQEKLFRIQMLDNGYDAVNNYYVIHVSDADLEKVKHCTREIKSQIVETGGSVDTTLLAQTCFYRISQPGQGYKSPFWRLDLSVQVAGMMPTLVFNSGIDGGEQLRMGLYGQPIRLSYPKDGVNHSLSSARTGSGKDVEKQATIWETYPLGTNWLGIEIGRSYEWTVNALNADSSAYHVVDPSHTVINPFPPYNESDTMSDVPLDPHVTEGTVRTLAFILLDDPNIGKASYQVPQIEQAVAETALQLLYAVPKDGYNAPLFEDYHRVLSDQSLFVGKPEQQKAALRMANNLGAFLDTAEGRLFNQQSNVVFNPDLCFFDLKPVANMPRLFKYYLLFLGIRFAQILYQSSGTTRFLLNEFHLMVKIAPDVVGGLMDAVSRMGRKEGKSLDMVTQENDEIDCISSAIINSLDQLVLLYRKGDKQTIGDRLDLPQTVIDVWDQFPHPDTINFRNGFRSMSGRFYNLMLSFSNDFLDISTTKESDLKLKEHISKITIDPFERIRLLRDYRINGVNQEMDQDEIFTV